METSELSMGRRVTFSHNEKACLQKLIMQYRLNTSMTKYGRIEISDRRKAWHRLTQDFNSIRTHSNRTVAQLKKCWDNIKSRRKQALEQQKHLKAGELCSASAESQAQSLDLDPLTGVKNENLPWSSDSDDEAVKDFLSAENNELTDTEVPPRTPSPHEPAQPAPHVSVTDNGTSPPQVSENRTRLQEREEELHKLRISERMWQLRTLKEQHRRAQIERERAELEREKAQFDRDKAQLEREKAQLDLIRSKRDDTEILYDK